MAKPIRITDDFVRTFRAVKAHLGGTYNADAFAAKLQSDPNFVAIVDHMDTLARSVLSALKRKKDKTIKQAHDDFAEQYNEFRTRWEQLPIDYLMWRIGPVDVDIEALMMDASPGGSVNIWDDDFEFDDEQESGASLVSDMVAHVRDRAEFSGGRV